jgi:hypothetical protein
LVNSPFISQKDIFIGHGYEHLKQGDHMEELGRDARIILKQISKKLDGTIFICLRIGTIFSSSECCYESSGNF